MRVTDMVRYSLRNAFRRKVRATLTITAIIIGALTFTITSGLGAAVTSYLDLQAASLGATNTIQVTATSSMAILSERLDEYDEAMVSAAPGTNAGILSEADVARIRTAAGAGRVVTTIQTNPQFFQLLNEKKFRFVYNGYWPGKIVNLLVGEQVNDAANVPELVFPSYAIKGIGFPNAKDAIGAKVVVGALDARGGMHEISATVVGVQERSLVGGNLPFGNQAFDRELQRVSWIGAEPGAAKWYPYALVVSDNVPEAILALQKAGFAATTVAQTVGSYKSIIAGILLLLNLLASIAIAAAMFGIVNTLLMSVQERTRNIGLFRALGMSRRTVFISVTFEAFALGVSGSIVAVALGVVLALLSGPALLKATALDLPGLNLFEFDGLNLVAIVVGVTLSTMVAAVLPAVRASRLNPMDALREEH